MFQSLPDDLKLEILIIVQIPTFSQLCSANSQIYKLCYNERLWKQKFYLLTGKNDLISEDYMSSVKLIWSLLNTKKCITVVHYNERTDIETVFGSYLVNSVNSDDECRKCVVNDYNNKIEPMYSTIKQDITKFNKNWLPDNIQDLELSRLCKRILTETELLTSSIYDKLIRMFEQISVFYDFYHNSIIYVQDNTIKTMNIVINDDNYDMHVITFAATFTNFTNLAKFTKTSETTIFNLLQIMLDMRNIFDKDSSISRIIQYIPDILNNTQRCIKSFSLISGQIRKC